MTRLADESSAMEMNDNFRNSLHNRELSLVFWLLGLFKRIDSFRVEVDPMVYI